mmetsp:Transcript_7667/g.16053  ORF Transcript_7667/g.16053 Transcript_7667/m.16053 type:complete len:214 (-) Transcript_7667:713-1354(-)
MRLSNAPFFRSRSATSSCFSPPSICAAKACCCACVSAEASPRRHASSSSMRHTRRFRGMRRHRNAICRVVRADEAKRCSGWMQKIIVTPQSSRSASYSTMLRLHCRRSDSSSSPSCIFKSKRLRCVRETLMALVSSLRTALQSLAISRSLPARSTSVRLPATPLTPVTPGKAPPNDFTIKRMIMCDRELSEFTEELPTSRLAIAPAKSDMVSS